MRYILHAELFTRIPLRGKYLRHLLARRVTAIAAAAEGLADPDISVVIRTKNDISYIKSLLADIRAQVFDGAVEIILVDTMSTDGTPEYARQAGAKVVSISQAEFTYPKALNLGFEQAKHPYVFTLVGHSNLTNTMTFKCLTVRAQSEKFGGVFGFPLTNCNATMTERIAAALWLPKFMKTAKVMPEPRAGLLAANSAIISRAAWEKFGGFDERYAAGGEDSALGRAMLADRMIVAMDPACTVFHSHALGPIDSWRQLKHWSQLDKPLPFEIAKVNARRPDLRQK